VINSAIGHSSSAYCLPAPEGQRRQRVREQPYLAGALDHVVRGGEQAIDTECENDGVRMEWAQAPVTEPGDIEIEGGPGQLRGDKYAGQHADHAPHDGGDRELPDNLVVVI
jgi:hypothetical protein